ncbi:MAG: Maf family protein [Verrucomicrobiota bacterium]
MSETVPLILASSSPRRRDLLAEAGLSFAVRASAAEELHDPQLSAAALTEENAFRKASAVASEFPSALVLGADTLVYLDGEPFGKPRDLEEAFFMLSRLAGRTHQVCTGVCLLEKASAKQRRFHAVTAVTFRALDPAGIGEYLASIDPLDKAGGYAAQEHGEKIIERLDGSWSNVIGLPMEALQAELKNWKI